MVLNGHVTLDRLMFYHSFFYPFAFTFGFVMSKASLHQHIFDESVINELFKGEVFEFIGIGRIKNCMMLCESHQDRF